MTRAAPLAALLAVLATPALSLSCLPPDVARSYQRAAEAEEAYVVVSGVLRFDETRLPKADMSAQQDTPPETKIPARITGMALTQSGFDHAFDREITLNVLCFGPWCGGAKPDIRYLGFLQKTDTGYELVADPCGSFAFAEPGDDMLHRVEQCFQGGPCKPAIP